MIPIPPSGKFVRRFVRQAVIAASLGAAFLSAGPGARAGVTGNVIGVVRSSNGAPIAGVAVRAASPSMTRSATTDGSGHFVILALAPDTYTIYLRRAEYDDVSFPGVTILADQTQAVTYTMRQALPTIAHVGSTGSASLVQPGVGSDVYSVNSTQAAAAAALGGPGNLNNVYSAMASVPGIQVSQGGIGWDFNGAYVRGQNEYYTGYEYDGIPVNRAFDNYTGSTEPSLGLQELQVYTGGGPPSVGTNSTAGFINEVIKTGTFPGFATVDVGIGGPAYYHQAQVEVGGSTPDRTFSYYVGLMGYNQTYRIIDNSNGAGYSTPGGIFSGVGFGFADYQQSNVGYMCWIGICQGVKPMCPLYGQKFTFPDQGCWQYVSATAGNPLMVTDRESVVNVHLGIPKANGLRDDVQLLWSGSALDNYGYNSPSDLGPGVNQFIYSLYNTKYAPPICGNEPFATWGTTVVLSGFGCTSPPGSAQQVVAFLQPNQFFWEQHNGYGGQLLCPAWSGACAPTYVGYADSINYNLPFGTPVAKSPATFKAPSVYFAPGAPPHPFDGPLPLYDNSIDVNQNDSGITKLQYTHALSQSAYLRAYAYTFYSDWLINDPTAAATFENVSSYPGAPDYELTSHTSGGALAFEDQVDSQNLVSFQGNYTTASVVRVNSSTAYGGISVYDRYTPELGSPIGYMAKSGNGYNCYDPTTGLQQICLALAPYGVYYNATATAPSGESCGRVYNSSCVQEPTWLGGAMTGPTGWPNSFAPAGSPAAKAGAMWDTLWNSNLNGLENTVRPRFITTALEDQFRPSDKLLINAAIRYDDFTYDLPDSITAATQFYANMLANYSCVFAATDQVLWLYPPNSYPTQYVEGDCNRAASVLHVAPHTGWVHPNGTVQDGVQAPNFTASSPSSYTLNYWEPRFSGTYTVNPNTVIRAAAGRFVQPPISASLQYLSASGDARFAWSSSMNLGFYSPFHPIPGVSAAIYDLSWEQRLKGTDVSFKITPFYTWVTDWQQIALIGGLGFASQIPVGVNRDEGVEFQLLKGDFSRNGLSGMFAFTYTNSKVRYQNIPWFNGGVLPNQLIEINAVIAQYNQLTKAGGGSPCYQAGKGVRCSTRNGKVASGDDTILNPYYNDAPQGLLDENAWYNPYSESIVPGINGDGESYISPYVSALILNWKHNKLAVTPSFNFQTGGYYGSPLDVGGLDPRVCYANSAATGITKVSPKTNPLQCNYIYETGAGQSTFGQLLIPNPQTGTFLLDNYEQPSSLVGNLQVSYDVNPRVRLVALGTTLFHACFGGTPAPWTAVYPPGYVICGYSPGGGSYPANYYNGTSIYDYKANGARTPFTQSYVPSTVNNGAVGAAVQPIQVYVNAQVRI